MTKPTRTHAQGEDHSELLPWSDEDLAEMSTVTEKDRHGAAAHWRRLLPKRLRDLLQAVRADEAEAT